MRKTANLLTATLCVALACFGVAQYAASQTAQKTKSSSKSTSAPPTTTQNAVANSAWGHNRAQKLFSTNEKLRFQATADLTKVPYDVERFIGEQMAQPKFWQNRDAEGSTVMALQVLGIYGSEFIVPDLADHIGFKIDPKTFKVGDSRTVIAPYPVASALAQIGGLPVRRSVLQKLYRTENESELRLCVWVLNETEGPEVARVLLDLNFGSIEKRVAPEEAELATANLKRATELLADRDSLLRF